MHLTFTEKRSLLLNTKVQLKVQLKFDIKGIKCYRVANSIREHLVSFLEVYPKFFVSLLIIEDSLFKV